MTKKRKGYSIIPNLEKSREMPQDTRDNNIANLNHGDIDAIVIIDEKTSRKTGKRRVNWAGIHKACQKR